MAERLGIILDPRGGLPFLVEQIFTSRTRAEFYIQEFCSGRETEIVNLTPTPNGLHRG